MSESMTQDEIDSLLDNIKDPDFISQNIIMEKTGKTEVTKVFNNCMVYKNRYIQSLILNDEQQTKMFHLQELHLAAFKLWLANRGFKDVDRYKAYMRNVFITRGLPIPYYFIERPKIPVVLENKKRN